MGVITIDDVTPYNTSQSYYLSGNNYTDCNLTSTRGTHVYETDAHPPLPCYVGLQCAWSEGRADGPLTHPVMLADVGPDYLKTPPPDVRVPPPRSVTADHCRCVWVGAWWSVCYVLPLLCEVLCRFFC